MKAADRRTRNPARSGDVIDVCEIVMKEAGGRRRTRNPGGATVEIYNRWLRKRRLGGRTHGLAILGLLAFLSFALMFAPARLLARLAEAMPGASLGGTTGTVWSGSGQLRLWGQKPRAHHLVVSVLSPC